MLAIELGEEAEPERAWEIMHKSPSKITSWTPISYAKSIASSIAFVSAWTQGQ